MIEVKFASKLVLPTIEMPIYNESKENDPEFGAGGVRMQTKVDGILAPLVKLNSVTIMSSQIKNMHLTCDKFPRIELEIEDTMMLFKSLDNPSNDNILQVQLLPQFDNVYKKINLTFFITDYYLLGGNINITGIYNIPKLWDTCMEAFGKITSYEFFEQVAKSLGLGFCSNIDSIEDSRYIFSKNNNIINLMNSEIEYSGKDEHVCDYWIDYWNNLNFIDIYKEYSLIESDENMKLWVEDLDYNKSDSEDKSTPIEIAAVITNSPIMENTQLYVTDYTPASQSSMITDQIIEIYEMDTNTTSSITVIDGDIKNDVFKTYTYYGENVGETKYLNNRITRQLFLNKVNGTTIEVELPRPMLGLMRGGKVNFFFYDINRYLTEEIAEKTELKSNIKLPENIITDDAKYIINASVSGQYYIINSSIHFEQGKWRHVLKLGRYIDEVNKYLNDERK